MSFEELREFYEMNYIDIKKFLNDNFNIVFGDKKNSRGKKWRCSHNEILNIPLVVPISAMFSMRYIELVKRGKIVVVRDEFGKFQTYINPKIIKEILNEPRLLEELKDVSEPFNDLSIIAVRYFERKYLYQKLEEIEETKKILKHFHADDTLAYVESLSRVADSRFTRCRIKK